MEVAANGAPWSFFIMIGDGPVVMEMIVSFWQEANGTPWIYAVKCIFVLIE